MPQVLELVELAFVADEDVYDHIYVVHQHPFTLRQAFLAVRYLAQFFAYLVYHMVGDGPYLRGRIRLTNDEPAAHRIGDIFQVQDNNVLPLLILNTIDDEIGLGILQRGLRSSFSHTLLLMLHKITDSLRSNHNTVFTGKVLVELDECPSTNDWLKEALRTEKPPEGLVVTTRYQSAGRGQSGRIWQVEPGMNLTFSVLFRPVFLSPAELFLLNQTVALAVYDVVGSALPEAQVHIKWPNDLLINGKKAAGILLETTVRKQVETAIIGIGLNVLQTDFPGLPDATSLNREGASMNDPQQLLFPLLQQLETGYLLLRNGRSATGIRQRYHEHLLGMNQKRTFRAADRDFEATVLGVSDDGLLRLEMDGKEERFSVGSIGWE